MWLDAADGSTLTLSGSAVSSWVDRSGNGRHFTQADPARQPEAVSAAINGRTAVAFSQDHVRAATFDLGNQVGFFFVSTVTGTGALNRIDGLFDSAPGTVNVIRAFGGTWEWWSQSPGVSVAGDTGVTNLSAFVHSLAPSRSIAYFKNGAHQRTASNPSTTSAAWAGPTIGSINSGNAGWFTGRIGEVVIVQAAVSDTDRQKLEGYLAHKWGLTANLPAGHPYKANPPTA